MGYVVKLKYETKYIYILMNFNVTHIKNWLLLLFNASFVLFSLFFNIINGWLALYFVYCCWEYWEYNKHFFQACLAFVFVLFDSLFVKKKLWIRTDSFHLRKVDTCLINTITRRDLVAIMKRRFQFN